MFQSPSHVAYDYPGGRWYYAMEVEFGQRCYFFTWWQSLSCSKLNATSKLPSLPITCFMWYMCLALQVLRFLNDRMLLHKKAFSFCKKILTKKVTESKIIFRSDLSEPVRDVDLVITIGGDGTLLHASHFIDDSIPLVGVNSDPTQPEEVCFHLLILSCQCPQLPRPKNSSFKEIIVISIRWRNSVKNSTLQGALVISVLPLPTTLNRWDSR